MFFSHKPTGISLLAQLQRALSAAVRFYFGDISKACFLGFLNSFPLKTQLARAAFQEGLAGILYRVAIQSGCPALWDKQDVRNLESFYYGTLLINEQRFHELEKTMEKTAREKIPVVLLKGVSLARGVYGDPGVRAMSDIDLWVLATDYDRTACLLQELGFKRDAAYPTSFAKGKTKIDLHTHFIGADRIRARRFLLSESEKLFFERTRPLDFGGRSARVLDPLDQVIHLWLHALKHNLAHLIWLVDIYALVRNWGPSDWQALQDRAARLGLPRFAAQVHFMISSLFPSDLVESSGTKSRLPQPGPVSLFLLKQKIARGTLPAWAPLVLFAPQSGGISRSLYLMETLFPKPEVLRQVFWEKRNSPSWFLYLIRTGQIFSTAFSSLFSRNNIKRK